MKFKLLFTFLTVLSLTTPIFADSIYLPVVHGAVGGSTVPPVENAVPNTRPRQPGVATVVGRVTRYNSDAIKVVLLPPGNISRVVHLDLLIQRDHEHMKHALWLRLGQTQEVYLDGGTLAVYASTDGGVYIYQWIERADWTLVGTATWL